MDININEGVQVSSNSAKAQKLNNGLIWFICFLPLIGLFFEKYADSKTAGIVLWVLVPLMMIGSSLADIGQLRRQGIETDRLIKWVWLTPVYVYKREKLCGRELYKAIICGFFVIAALFMNSFTQSIKIDTDYMTISAQNSYVQSLDNFSGSSAKVIGDCITAYLGEDAEWGCTKDGDNYTVTAEGSHGSDSYKITFVIVYDGFTYCSFKISDVVKNGVSLRDDDFSAACKAIFIDGDESSESDSNDSDTTDSSSEA